MTAERQQDGPNLREYVETRFNLLTEMIKDTERTRTDELNRFAASAKDATIATDLRYQQRFEAQSDALAAAFLSQQTAMQTAFQVAEKAVQAALAAADRAVSKAELASDKRFEALNELRQMLNEMMATLVTRVEAVQRFDAIAEKIEMGSRRAETTESRLNTLLGGREGHKERQADSRAGNAQLLSVAAVVLTVIGMLIMLWMRRG